MNHPFRSAITYAVALCLFSEPAGAGEPEKAGAKGSPDVAAAPAPPEGKKLLAGVTFPDAKALRMFAFTDPAAWRWGFSDEDGKYIEHFQQSKYKYPVRSPFNIALLKDYKFGSFVMDMEVQQTGRDYGHRDLCFFFGARDPSHFYYVHIATKSDPHAHNIMIVNGSPRVSISEKATEGHDWGKDAWHHIRIARDIESGKIEVFANDMATPIMTATDKTFGTGWVGFGSFDDTGRVRAIRVYGEEGSMTEEEVPFFRKHGG